MFARSRRSRSRSRSRRRRGQRQRRQQLSVRDDVGVASNRRREVRVHIQRETVVQGRVTHAVFTPYLSALTRIYFISHHRLKHVYILSVITG